MYTCKTCLCAVCVKKQDAKSGADVEYRCRAHAPRPVIQAAYANVRFQLVQPAVDIEGDGCVHDWRPAAGSAGGGEDQA